MKGQTVLLHHQPPAADLKPRALFLTRSARIVHTDLY